MNSTTAAFSPLLDKIHSISPDPPLALAKEVEQLTENLDKLFQQHSSFDISPYKRRCQQAQDELTEMISAIENEKAASLANAPRSTRVKAALEQYRDKLQSLELGLAPYDRTFDHLNALN
jgi:septation ring formation regulator EzrA